MPTNSLFGNDPNQVVLHAHLGVLAYLRPEDLILPYMHVRDEKAQGTSGGNSSASTYHDRTLNTVVANTIPTATLSSNQITLPAGTYDFDIRTPGYSSGGNSIRAYLYNVTDSVVAAYGPNAAVAGSSLTHAVLKRRITTAASKTFKVQMYSSSAATDGLGSAMNIAGQVEIYTEVFIQKVG